jgi:uncharacterized protein YkwD
MPHCRRILLSISLFLFATPGLKAQTASLPEALSTVRTQGCDGRPGAETRLRLVPALSDAARRIADGSDAQAATRAAGYRATRFVQINLGGVAGVPAIVEALRARYCQAITDPALTDLGVHRRGNTSWVLLAQPFSPPEMAHSQEVARAVLERVNQARSQPRRCGEQSFAPAPPLRLASGLQRAAEIHAQDMARGGFMGHEGSDGSSVSDRADRVGYDWRTVGENVAAGSETAEQVVQGWLRSPDHCANIMQPAFTEMGLAFAVNERSPMGIYWAQVFGRPR